MPSMLNRQFSSSSPLQPLGPRFVKSKLFTLMMVITALAACNGPTDPTPAEGSNNENKKPNTQTEKPPIQCDRGVPSSDGKACTNSDNCNGKTSACIEGYACKKTLCVAVECGEGKPDCPRGECSTDGICVSKAVCQAGDAAKACVDGEVCIGGHCEVPQTCDSVGTCSIADPICMARRASCEEAVSCSSNDHCRQGRFCNPTTSACEVDKCITPTGKKDCAAEGGGICNSATGLCDNAKSCTAASQCKDNADLTLKKICSDIPNDASATEKQCRSFNTVCDATCRDINRCQYDATGLTLTCGDGSCSTINDCGKTQYCDGSACQEISSYTCVNDSHEQNDDKANATTFGADKSINDLTVCPNDVDVFVIDDVSPYMVAGKLFVADLQFKEASRGRKVNAKMSVEFVEVNNSAVPPTESVVESYELEANRQEATEPAKTYHDDIVLSKRIDHLTNVNKIYIKVEHNDSANTLGVDYSLKVEANDKDVFAMCEKQTELVFTKNGTRLEAKLKAQDLNNTPTSAASFPSEPACTDPANDTPELAYRFTVPGTAPKKVVIDALPAPLSDLDVTLAVLTDCTSGTFDLNPLRESGCRDKKGASARETYETLLEPGDYTVVVTAKNKAALGTGIFDLTVQMYDTTCIPEDVNECVGDSKVTCDVFLTKTETVACGVGEKCHDMGGGAVGCTYDFGFACDVPFAFDKDRPLSLDVETSNMKGQSPTYNSKFDCDGKIDASLVANAEVYLKATVPPNYTAVVVATPAGTAHDNFTLYTMKACGATSCESASLRDGTVGPRTLSYKNTGTSDEEIYFVLETQSGFGQALIEAKVVETSSYTVCVPGETKCDTTDPTDHKVAVCKDTGSGYAFEETSCGVGIACDSSLLPAACEFAGDTCDKPITIQPNQTYSYKLQDFSPQINSPGNTCPRQNQASNMTQEGTREAVFKIDPPTGTVAEVVIEPTAMDAIVWQINGDCSVINTANHCKVGADSGGNGKKETLRLLSDGSPILFVVEGVNTTSPSSRFDVKVEYLEGDCHTNLAKPTCDTGSGVVTYCDAEDIKRTVTCALGCSETPARCNNMSADDKGAHCGMPIFANESGNTEGLESFTIKTSGPVGTTLSVNGMVLDSGLNGECTVEPETERSNFKATLGPDMIYAFKLEKDQVLEYKLQTNTSTENINNRLRVYILDDTCSPDSCRNMRDRHFVIDDTGHEYKPFPNEDYKYYSRLTGPGSEIVYLVVDTTWLSASTLHGSLSWKIKTNPHPGVTEDLYGSHCGTGAESNSVMHLDRDGTSWTSTTCPTGTQCKHGACMPVKSGAPAKIAGDVCDATIPTLTTPAFLVLESSQTPGLVEMTNDAAPLCGMKALDTQGVDYFFKTEIPAGAILSVRGISAGYSAPTIYIAEDCTKLKSGSADACLAGSQGAGGRYHASQDHALVEYYNSTGSPKVVTVGLDSSAQLLTPRAKEAFYYIVDTITAPNCTNPGAISCSLDSALKARLYRCTGGELKPIDDGECHSNQCHSNGVECQSEGDSALQAKDLTYATTETTVYNTVLHESRDSSDSLVKTNPGNQSFVYGSCPFMQKPIGPDYYYAIDLQEGDYLTATLDKGVGPNAGTQRGMLFYLLDTDGKTCITLSQPSSHTRTLANKELPLNFQAFRAGRYYLVVDSLSEKVEHAKSNFKITYKVEKKGANDCVAYATQCKDANNLYICDVAGTQAKDVACPHGCIGRACRSESTTGTSYDICTTSDQPITSPRLFIYDDDSSTFNKDFEFTGKPPCGPFTTNKQAKTDLFVKVQLKNDEYLKVLDLRSTYSFGPTYSIMEPNNCTTGNYYCETAARKVGNWNDSPDRYYSTELKDYISKGTKDVYLGVTSASRSTIYGNAGLFYVEFKKAACNPESISCSVSGTTATVSYCTDVDSPPSSYTCASNACNGKVCQAATTNAGNEALAPIDLDTAATWSTDGTTQIRTGVYTGSTDGRENSYGAKYGYSNACRDHGVSKNPGRDVFHKVKLEPGEKLDVILDRTSGSPDPVLYLYRIGTANLLPSKTADPYPYCYAGRDVGQYGGNTIEEISYTYPAGYTEPGEFLIVADAYDTVSISNDHYDYKLTVKITPAP